MKNLKEFIKTSVFRLAFLASEMYYKSRRCKKEAYFMVTALNVANCILKRAFKENCKITPMKLQKLIYFVYKGYFKKTKQPLFSERFEAWRYGPVVASVYNAFRHYGSNRIRHFYTDKDGTIWSVDENSNIDFWEALNFVWTKYSNSDGIELSMITHRENTAWYEALDKGNLFLSDDDINDEVWLS